MDYLEVHRLAGVLRIAHRGHIIVDQSCPYCLDEVENALPMPERDPYFLAHKTADFWEETQWQ